MPSLRRAEAHERAELITVGHYRLTLDLPKTGPEFVSDVTIAFSARPGSHTFLDVQAAGIVSAELNGRPLDPGTVVDGRLPLTGLQPDNEVRVVARMRYSNDGEGLHRHIDPLDGNVYLYAMSFLDAAPRWFACFDQPDLKARYDIEVRCPASWIVLGNSPATRLSDGHWQLATSRPMSTYFVTLAAGPYASVTDEHDGIPLGLHARASLAEPLQAEAADLFRITKDSFDAYHELFRQRYPWGEYHQVFVPDFNAGAMENPGCVTLREQYVFRSRASEGERVLRAATVAHEMGHMWFGDLVTMRWWDDLWLNESFAEYLAYRVCAGMDGYPGRLSWTQYGITRKDWGSVADQAPSTHPVAGNGASTAAAALQDFDGISYAKGASALRQLAAYLGDDVFRAGLDEHFARHAFGNATLEDLLESWTRAGASDLPNWSKQWLQTAGLDTITAELRDSQAVLSRLSPDDADRPHRVTVAGYDEDAGLTATSEITLGAAEVRLPMPAATRYVVADATDETWAKHRLGSWTELAALLGRAPDNRTRTMLYNALRDGVRSAELSSERALDILVAALATEPEELVLAEMLGYANRYLLARFALAAERPGRRARVAQLAQARLAAAGAGSDLQLTAARGLIATSDDSELLARWLAGSVPAGLDLDAELRWSLVIRLAALGGLGEAEIAAEQALDPSTAGALHAARARAIRPDAVAKAEAWQALTEPSSRSAYEIYEIAQAFFEPSQDELTAPYAARFFPAMAATAEFRTGFPLSQTIGMCYPFSHASPQLLTEAERALAGPLADGVRRAFLDATDVARRAVAVRQRRD